MTNELYPIFLKVDQLNVLIVGGGHVALEKLHFLLKSSPNANVLIIAKSVLPDLVKMAKNKRVSIVERAYNRADPYGCHLVIAATNQPLVNQAIYKDCKRMNILVNVADTPKYCDFYLGGIVTKGEVKIAISTNGQSPTLAKRLRAFFETVIPDEIDLLAKQLHTYRQSIGEDMKTKVRSLNEATALLIKQKQK